MDAIIARIQNALSILGWSRRELARQLGRNPLVVNRWCTGESPPGPDLVLWLEALARFRLATPPPQYIAPIGWDARRTEFCSDLSRADVEAVAAYHRAAVRQESSFAIGAIPDGAEYDGA